MNSTSSPVVPLDANELYGLMAEFRSSESILAAVRRARAAGYTRLEAYSPFPVHGLAEALGRPPSKLPVITFAGGMLGALAGYGLQYWASVISYPMNIGGRPYHSWPAFLPVVFELAVLGAALSAVLGMLALNGLPAPYHPVFNVPEFKLASRDRFFLSIDHRDSQFRRDETHLFLSSLAPEAVYEVPR